MDEKKVNQDLERKLLAAQENLIGVRNDGKNAFAGYTYTTVEKMIAVARKALHSAGLSLRREGWSIEGDISSESVVVHSVFKLADPESGGAATFGVSWVAMTGKGRPIDKAIAGALSSTWTYFLRDLLLVERSDEAEMDNRDDSAFVSAPKAAPKRPATKKVSTGGGEDESGAYVLSGRILDDLKRLDGSAAIKARANEMRNVELAEVKAKSAKVYSELSGTIRDMITKAEEVEARADQLLTNFDLSQAIDAEEDAK